MKMPYRKPQKAKCVPIKDRVKGRKYLTRCGRVNIWDGKAFRNPDRYLIESSKPNFRQRRREIHIQHTYGLSPEQYVNMYQEQKGGCGICQQSLVLYGRMTYVDHCHITKLVRGLLCPGCNTGMAYVDREGFYEKARAYSRRYRALHNSNSGEKSNNPKSSLDET